MFTLHSVTDTADGSKPERKKPTGASPEHMREMTRKRMEMAKLDPSKKGGRPRTRFTKKEAEADALQRMMPRALAVLEEQLESTDQRVRQAAAVKVLEWAKGKPVQAIQQQVAQITEIRYESAAWTPDLAIAQNGNSGIAMAPLLLPEADEDDSAWPPEDEA